MSYHTPLTTREATFFDYLYKKMQEKRRDYVNTNYYYIKNIAGYKNIPGARYLVKKLAKKKLIVVQEGINWKGRQYLKIKIAKPLVVKKLFEEYMTQKSTEREEASQANRNEIKASKTTLPLNNNIIINQVNHSEEKRKTTIVQDMIQTYNEITSSTITPSRELAPLLVAAYKQKFKTMERWRQYLKHKVWGRIKNTFQFLRRILAFGIINAAMGEMGMSAELPTQYTQEAAYNHVDTLKETPACLYVRRELIDRKGAAIYFSWLTKAKLREEDGCIVACGDNSFITEYLNTQFRLEFERYYDEWRRNHSVEADKIIEEREEQMIADISVTGRVGFMDVKETPKGKVLKLALSHDQSQKKDGRWNSETVWYRVTYSCATETLKDLQKGDVVRALGTLNILHGNKKDGTPYTSFCVLAKDVKRLFKSQNTGISTGNYEENSF